jgi:hypothetical protein
VFHGPIYFLAGFLFACHSVQVKSHDFLLQGCPQRCRGFAWYGGWRSVGVKILLRVNAPLPARSVLTYMYMFPVVHTPAMPAGAIAFNEVSAVEGVSGDSGQFTILVKNGRGYDFDEGTDVPKGKGWVQFLRTVIGVLASPTATVAAAATAAKAPTVASPATTAPMEDAPQWTDELRCSNCRQEFTLIKRKHHCRNCGKTFCDDCSHKACPIPAFQITENVRVCDECYDSLMRASIRYIWLGRSRVAA